MKVIKQYKVKSKWPIYVDVEGMPYLGYYGDYRFKNDLKEGKYTLLPEKTNVLMYGALMLVGTSRGRSAAHFILKSGGGWNAHMTMVGTEKLIHAVANDDMTMVYETWEIPEMGWDGVSGVRVPGTVTHTGAAVTGYWTVAKQGTEVSLIPAPSDILSALERHLG